MTLTQLPLREAPLVFLDVETTGLRSDLGHRVVEVAVLQTRGLEKINQFSSLINPQRSIEPEAMRVHGITLARVANAPTFAQIIPRLQQFLQESIIVAHNAPFDMNFIQTEYNIARERFESGPILDTLRLARQQYCFYSNSLSSIAQTLNIRTPNVHRAMGDVLTTYAVFRRFSGDLIRRNRPLVEDWLRMQGGIAWTPEAASSVLEADHPLLVALSEARWVRIQYQARGGRVTQRLIKPLNCSGNYLVAYCQLRREQRTFRLDRIIKIEFVEE